MYAVLRNKNLCKDLIILPQRVPKPLTVEIVDDLFDTGNADEAWKKGVKDKLKVARRYLKIDFKSHIGKSDECGDHCMTYALSDEKNPDEFSSQCDHNHNLVCERCDALRDVLNYIFTQINNSDMQDQKNLVASMTVKIKSLI
jgi:hypothetical protein